MILLTSCIRLRMMSDGFVWLGGSGSVGADEGAEGVMADLDE